MIRQTLLQIIFTGLLGFTTTAQSFYDFTVKDIDGNDFSFMQLKGKKVLVVNVASECGYTPQYEELQKLFEKYGDDDFIIIGFPANDFLNQEPGTDAEIKTFCTVNYGVSFPVMSKISVKGKEMHPVYQWLTQKELNGKADSSVKWNFQKYLIDENGNLTEVFAPKIAPMDEVILKYLEK